jgi:hypothetical protein
MKKIFFTIVIAFCLTATYAQSKKEQIVQLTFSLDSLNNILAKERNNFNAKINELYTTIEQQNNDIETQKTEIIHLNKQLETKQLELTAKQAELHNQRNETARVNMLLITKTQEIEQLEALPPSDYLIVNNSVGFFKLGETWQNFAKNHYYYKSVQGYGTCLDACCDGGYTLGKAITNGNYGQTIENPEITIGALRFGESESKTEHKNNANLFYISSDNCSGWYWKDKISYIMIYSEAFKTKEGVGVGTTLEKLKEILGEVVINIGWLEEDANAVQVKINSYPSIEFILDVDDAIGGYEKLSTLDGTATILDFKKNTKIKRLIVRKTTN